MNKNNKTKKTLDFLDFQAMYFRYLYLISHICFAYLVIRLITECITRIIYN